MNRAESFVQQNETDTELTKGEETQLKQLVNLVFYSIEI